MGLLDYIQEKGKGLLAGGAKPRAIVAGLLGGDTSALKGAWNEVKQLGDPSYMRKVKGINNKEAMNIALDANPVFALTAGGKLADALDNVRPKTKYELAHEVAQKNAVEMLGLPPNNTAMDRAKALGFDAEKPLYHATNIENIVNPRASQGSLGEAFYTAENPNNLELFAKMQNIKMKNMGKEELPISIYPLLSKKLNKYDIGSELPINKIDTGKLESQGYDSVYFDRGGRKENAIINTSNIRSRFAAFDPARAHEADLLGNASPELLAYLSAGGLLGAGAYKYSQGDK